MRKIIITIASVQMLLGLGTLALDRDCDAAPCVHGTRLQAVLESRPENMKSRYQYRHPQEMLTFFGVAPGMTVADTLTGRDWFSSILLPYLGEKGTLVGVDLAHDTWVGYMGDRKEAADFLAKRAVWPDEYVATANAEWREEGHAEVKAMSFGNVPEDMKGTIDVFLMVRAAHLVHNFGPLEATLQDVYAALKPGGIFGIVQHRAPEENSDGWANGENGYLKQSAVIEAVKAAGFEFVAASEMNANPKDQPSESDSVWRLPPTMSGSENKPEKRAAMQAIGESDRMTLKFRKPE